MSLKKPELLASVLWIPRPLRARIECAARWGFPHGTCGVLIGKATRERIEVKRVVDAQNLANERSVHRYELDPLALLRAERQAQELGLSVVGIWQSHPDQPAQPSEADRALAWEGWSYLIVSVGPEGAREFKSWRLVGGDFEEEGVEVR